MRGGSGRAVVALATRVINLIAVVAKIGSHPQDEANHPLPYAMAPLSAGGPTIAVRASAPVAELPVPAGKEVSLSAHSATSGSDHTGTSTRGGLGESELRMLAEIEAQGIKKICFGHGRRREYVSVNGAGGAEGTCL